MVTNLTTSKYLLEEKDFQEYLELFFYSFNLKRDKSKEEFLRREFNKSDVYGLKEDNQLMASMTCIPFKVNFFDRTFKMTGIANVMSSPEYLPSDSIKKLFEQAFEDMYHNQITLSYLGPFSYDYYRRFGYEQVFEYLRMEIPFEKLHRYKRPMFGRIKRYSLNQAQEEISNLFAKSNRYGGVLRKNWWWNAIPYWQPEQRLAVSFDDLNKVDGYLIYSFDNDNFLIHDFVYQTQEAFLNLMHFVNKHRSIYKNVIINSSDTNLKVNTFVTNPLDAKVVVEPSMMGRIVNLKQFFLNYPTKLKTLDQINIDVKDSLAWNNHTWNLRIHDGIVSFEKADKEIPDLSLNIQTLTKAMFGFQSLRDSYIVGNVDGEIEKIRELDDVFVQDKAQIKDSF